MANRRFNRHQSLEKEIKSLHVEVAIGASGAPTLTKGLGISSIERSATGDYKITLEDKYSRFMHMEVVHFASSVEDVTTQLKSEDVDGNKEIEFFTKAAGVAVDPSDGSKLFIRIDLKNSSVER